VKDVDHFEHIVAQPDLEDVMAERDAANGVSRSGLGRPSVPGSAASF
jgi:hypothetical protein